MAGKGEGEGEGETASYNIPQDLHGGILYRLPSTDLLNFKQVCKDWQRLISSTEFIQKHHERSKADCNNLKILVKSDSTVEIIDFANNRRKKISSHFHILGCCDGLVLYYDNDHHEIAALNPCTGESLLLVTMPEQFGMKLGRHMLKFSWFGIHPVTSQYVLVLAHEEIESITFEVYNIYLDCNGIYLSLFSSTTLDDEQDMGILHWIHSNEIGTLLHGRLHFPANANVRNRGFKFVIIVYDFEMNQITRMTHPTVKHPANWMLGVVDGCLCAIQDRQVWIMQVYGVEESWTKYANLDGFPVAFSPDGDVIICGDEGFMQVINKYSLSETEREREAKILSKFQFPLKMALHNPCIATVCIDSLISPTLLWFGVGDFSALDWSWGEEE